MTRFALLATFVLSVSFAGSAWAGDEVKAPCMDKPNQEAMVACLQEVLDKGVTILLPDCGERTGEELAECETRIGAYQKVLARVTGDPCYGMQDEKLAECKAAAPEPGSEEPAAEEPSSGGSSKKGGLSKHEGTKMERMSDEDDDEEDDEE